MSNCLFRNQFKPHLDRFEIDCYDRTTGLPLDCSECEQCPDNPVCKKSKTLWTVLDNTRTRFTWTMELLVTFTDGSTATITQTPTTGWTQQLNQWVTIFGDLLADKCGVDYLVEARCNFLPNGCGGLLPPPSELEGRIPTMFARYLQIGACSTCPAINNVEIISINGTPLAIPRPLVMDYIEGEEKRYMWCQNCGEEGILYFEDGTEVLEQDLPLCLFECSETFPQTPEAACAFELVKVCDSDNPNGINNEAFIQFADCGDGQVLNAFLFVDADGGFVEYTPNEGSVGSCGTELGSSVQCDSCGRQIEIVQYDDGVTLYYEYSEKGGRGELTMPIGELGKCDKDDCTQWATREGETCNDNVYPDGTKVQWIEGLDCDGNVVYPSGEIEYLPWGGTGVTGSTQPPVTTLNGIGLVEGLDTAVHTTDPDYTAPFVTGLPNQQTWVNMAAGNIIEGTFPDLWSAGTGDELVFETQWSVGQIYDVQLCLADNSYTPVVTLTFGASIGTQANTYQFNSGGTGSGTGQHFVETMSFADFGLTTEQVKGIRITLVNTNDPDFAGVYITENAILGEVTVFDEQPTSVVPSGCCVACDESQREVIGCSTEATAEVAIGDTILSIFTQDCNGSPVGDILQYNVSNNNTLLTIPVFTEACDPAPQLERTEDCIKDIEGVEWVELTLTDPLDPANPIILYYNQETNALGIPTGAPAQWTSCEDDCVKFCPTVLNDCGFCCSALVGTGRGGITTSTNFVYGGIVGTSWSDFTANLVNAGFSWEFITIYNNDGLPLADGNLLEICGPASIGTLTFDSPLGAQVISLVCEEKQSLNVSLKDSTIALPDELLGDCPQDCDWSMGYSASGLSGGMTDILFDGVSIYADLGYSGYTAIAGTAVYAVMENLETWLIANEDPGAIAQLLGRDSYGLTWTGQGPIEIVGDGGIPQIASSICGDPDKALRTIVCNADDLKSECVSIDRHCFCVVSQGKVKSQTKKTLSKEASTSQTKPGKILSVCRLNYNDCDGDLIKSEYEYQGNIFSEEKWLAGNYKEVDCDSPAITYSPGAVTCATVEVDGTTVVLNCTVFTNDSDPSDLFTSYTLAADYTVEGIGAIGDPYTPSTTLTVVECAPGSITEDETCYEATNAIKGLVNAGDVITVQSVTNSIAGTTVYTITNSLGNTLYVGDDPTTVGITLTDVAQWTVVDCDPVIDASSCCPVQREACIEIDGTVYEVYQYVDPLTGLIIRVEDVAGTILASSPKEIGALSYVKCTCDAEVIYSPVQALVCDYSMQFTGEPFTLSNVSAINTSAGLLALPNYTYAWNDAAQRTLLQNDLAAALGIPAANISFGLNRVGSTITVLGSPIELLTLQSTTLHPWVQSNCGAARTAKELSLLSVEIATKEIAASKELLTEITTTTTDDTVLKEADALVKTADSLEKTAVQLTEKITSDTLGEEAVLTQTAKLSADAEVLKTDTNILYTKI